MNKEEIDLLRYELIIDYYKNNNITEIYKRRTDNTVFDNEVLSNLESTLYITTLDKYNKLQEENKQLKEDYNKEKYLVDKLTRQLTDEYKNIENQYKLKNKYLEENKQLKEIINNLKEYIDTCDYISAKVLYEILGGEYGDIRNNSD